MTASRQPRCPWSVDQVALLRRLYADVSTKRVAEQLGRDLGGVYRKAAALGLRKSEAYLASPDACRLRRGDNVGAAFRFKPGHQTANKGLRRPGWAPGRMAETQFKKGQRSGVAVDLYKPIGTERISKDGYLERKIHDGMPLQSRWRAVHLLVWEERNGRIPPGHALAFRDGDKNNRAYENLELLTRAELMRRNSYHTRYPKELGLAIQLRGALVRQINKREKAST